MTRTITTFRALLRQTETFDATHWLRLFNETDA
jgi:hypothetical protein